MKTHNNNRHWHAAVALATGTILSLLTVPALAGNGAFQFGSSVVVPVVAILSVFCAPAVAVILIANFVLRHRERRAQLINERIQRLLEAGQPVPEVLLQDGQTQTTPERHLQQGLLLLGFGAGLALFLTLVSGFTVGSLGLIFIGLGIAKLIVWKHASRQD